MLLRKVRLLTVFSIFSLLAACSKDDKDKPSSGGLTDGRWKINSSTSSIDYGGGFIDTVDLYASMESCQQDNEYIFNDDGTSTTDEGATKCSTSSPQQIPAGTWELQESNTKLKITYMGTSYVADVLTLTGTDLKVRYVTYYGGVPATTYTNYTHID